MVTEHLYYFTGWQVIIECIKIWSPHTVIFVWHDIIYLKILINLNISYLLLTAVICHLSFNATGSTLLAPCSSLVQLIDGTNLIPVQSQFRISSMVRFHPSPMLPLILPKFFLLFCKICLRIFALCCCSLPLDIPYMGKLSWFSRFVTRQRIFSCKLWPCQSAI